MLNDIIKYAQGMNVQSDVVDWMNTHLKPYLDKNRPEQSEVEHIIDYMASDKRPKRISKMSYAQAKANTEKWNKTLIKKGSNIDEKPSDIEVIKDFKDGFKIVKLVGDSAYKREGFLMRHCVGSYSGRDKEIYSLRDKDNMPHCTMEKGQQVKGKGNGAIHPKYIKYVVAFLQEIGMTVGDSEMKNLGYVNVEKIIPKLHKTNNKFFNKKYLYQEETFYAKDGAEYLDLDIWDYKPLVTSIQGEAAIDFKLKINFDLKVFVSNAVTRLTKVIGNTKTKISDKREDKIGTSGYNTQIGTSGDSTQIGTSGYNTQIGTSGSYTKIGTSGDSTQIGTSGSYTQIGTSGSYTKIGTSGDSTKIGTSGDSTQIGTSGDSTKIGTSGDSTQIGTSGSYTQIGTSGDSTQIGTSGYNTQIGTSGSYTKIGTSGDSTQIGTSGYNTQIGTSGSYTKIGTSGYNTQIELKGDYGVIATVHAASRIKASKGTLVCLVHFGEDNLTPLKFVTGKIGEDGLDPDTWYKLDKDGNFAEVKE